MMTLPRTATKRSSVLRPRMFMRYAVIAAAAWAGMAAVAHGQAPIDDSRRNAIVRAVEGVTPAVVTVNVFSIQRQRIVDPFFEDFFRFFEMPRARIRERTVRSIGSGFIFDPRGYIMTNYHVVEQADRVTINLPDGRDLDVDLVGADPRTDLAVLKVDAANLPHVSFGDSDELYIGEWLIAFGNPFGLLVNDPQPSVSVGVLSANHRRVSRNVGGGERLFQNMIQTDAAINPGNSGGPLVNGAGEVIGVNTFIMSTSGGSDGLGFAIPINRAKRVAAEIIEHGRRRDPWPGFRVTAGPISPVVFEIYRTAPAYEAGMRPGDVILGVNGQVIDDVSDADFAFWDTFVGDEVTVDVLREGEAHRFRFPIVELRQDSR